VSFYSGDEATYSALASRILEGALPYHSAVDHKPIGIEILYASIYALFGRNKLIFVRIFLLVIVAMTGYTMGRLCEKLLNKPQARYAGVFYVLCSTWGLPSDTQAANTELFLNFPITLAGFLIFRKISDEKTDWKQSLNFSGAGILTAVAGMFKYQASLAGIAWALITVLGPWRFKTKIIRLIELACGFLLIGIAYISFFLNKGIWDSFIFWGFKYNFQYMSILTPAEIVWNAFRYTLLVALFWFPLLICFRKTTRNALLFSIPWGGAMALAIAAGGRFFPHYYLMLLPPLCLLISPEVLQKKKFQKFLTVIILIYSVAEILVALGWYRIKPNLAQYDKTYRLVGNWITNHSKPSDRIFVWGNSPEIYYYSNRIMGTRFPFCNYHTGKIWGTKFLDDVNATQTERNIVPRAWDELLQDLYSSPPLYFIDAAKGKLDRFDLHPSSRYPKLLGFLSSYCKPIACVEKVPIYKCK